jgi:hypothetical protein
MVKNQRQKLGMFSVSSKTNPQSGLRTKKMQDVRTKNIDTLDSDERKWAQKPMARIANQGKQFANVSKNDMIQIRQNTINKQNVIDNPEKFLNYNIHTQNEIPVSSFIGSKNTTTGVYSQKDVKGALSNIMSNLRNVGGVTKVDQGTTTNKKNYDINVMKDYQTAKFTFNPLNMNLTTKGWELDIPDDFIKISDTHYVAPTKEYESYDRLKRDTGYRKHDEEFDTYTPVEIKLYDDKKTISDITKRDTVMNRYYKKEIDDYNVRIKERDIYDKDIQKFFDTGILENKKLYDEYTKSDWYDFNNRDNYREQRLEDTYLKNEWNYNKYGNLLDEKTWDTYRTKDETEYGPGSYRYDDVDQEPYLKEHKEFDDYGELTRQQEWDTYRARDRRYTERTDDGINKRIDTRRDNYLRKDMYFDNTGNKTTELLYDEYLRNSRNNVINNVGVTNKKTNESFDISRDRWDEFSSDEKKQIQTEYIIDDDLNTKEFKEKEYGVGLRKINYYNPLTGVPIEQSIFW